MQVVHNRLRREGCQWYWDDEKISASEGAFLKHHYLDIQKALKEPWLTKDLGYDILGRPNYHWLEDK